MSLVDIEQRLAALRRRARAPVRTVLKVWQGMGYNRRALALRRAARIVVEEHGAGGTLFRARRSYPPDVPDVP